MNENAGAQDPLVSVIVPCRNDEDKVLALARALLATSYPKEKLEVIFVDGMSTDGTRRALEGLSADHPFVRVLDNPELHDSAALHRALKEARGQVIVRMDAGLVYADDHIERCVQRWHEERGRSVRRADAPEAAAVPIEPARAGDAAALLELLYGRIPAFWMQKVSRADLQHFLVHATQDERCSLLVARGPEGAPVGYVFALRDVKGFWRAFALRKPLLMAQIAWTSFRRRAERRGRCKTSESFGCAGAVCLPEFEWSPSSPANARIVGLYVHPEHRRKGIALSLYTRLFETLRAAGAAKVEEYMGEDYPQYAGKFPQACGWRLQQCACGGYKITKDLK